MTSGKGIVEPSSGGSFDKFILKVRLYPSFGGSIIFTTTPYATFTASMAPGGSPPTKRVSGGGVGNDNDSSRSCGFFIEAYKIIC